VPAKLKHMAIVSNDPERLNGFYQAAFGMKPDRGLVLTDGYVGVNFNRRAPGRQAGLDHFGFEVEDVEEIFARLRDDYPSVEWLNRPANRPFAGISMHDPAGNVFDLSQAGMENRKGVYAEAPGAEQQLPRHISHLVLRVMDPGLVAGFYQNIFGLRQEQNAPADGNFYLTDGTVRFVIAPWKIGNYAGSGIERPALDHVGFEVESLDAFQAELQRLESDFMPLAGRKNDEEEARTRLLATCPYGALHTHDPDGVLIDVGLRASGA
jgi:catechol 2,3-dioxygenase-like lactoylglutathione lyase family enzyme